mgnify:CR=1 FL=1
MLKIIMALVLEIKNRRFYETGYEQSSHQDLNTRADNSFKLLIKYFVLTLLKAVPTFLTR